MWMDGHIQGLFHVLVSLMYGLDTKKAALSPLSKIQAWRLKEYLERVWKNEQIKTNEWSAELKNTANATVETSAEEAVGSYKKYDQDQTDTQDASLCAPSSVTVNGVPKNKNFRFSSDKKNL